MRTERMLMFTDADRERIKQAVEQAEAGTSGEIVPMVVAASARYREAGFRTGLILAWLTLAILLTVEISWLPWGWHAGNAGLLLLGVILAYGIGEWLGRFPSVIRLVVSGDRMAQKVRLRAEQLFYQQSLHHTRAGTGILILVSLLERRVQVLADRGINERVPSGTWDNLVRGIIDGIRQGRATDAICEAIVRCGAFLAEVAPSRPGDNPNEGVGRSPCGLCHTGPAERDPVKAPDARKEMLGFLVGLKGATLVPSPRLDLFSAFTVAAGRLAHPKYELNDATRTGIPAAAEALRARYEAGQCAP